MKMIASKSTLCLSVALALSACGGGGGSGNDDQDNVERAGLKLDSENYAERAVAISADSEFDDVAALYEDLSDGIELVDELRDVLADQSGGESGTTACANEGGTATVRYDGEGWDDDETWQFKDCVVSTENFGAVLLNGGYRYVDRLTGETDSSETWQGFETYSITGQLLRDGDSLAIQGSGDWHEVYRWDNSGDSVFSDKIDSLEMRVGDRYVAVANGEFKNTSRQYDEVYAVSGTFIGSAVNGYFRLNTPTPLVFPDSEACASEGVMRLDADGYAEVRFGSSTGTGEAVVVEVNGNRTESSDDCSGYAPVL